MKRMMITLLAVVAIAVSASAMSYSKARTQALFLTDKMGYELNLSDDQYNAAYEINLDYMMCVNSEADLYGYYWTRRNDELKYVLSAYQFQKFMATSDFYRPITWTSNSFNFTIYSRYSKKRYFLDAPRVYDTYKGGNRQYQHSAYKGRVYSNEPNRNVRQHPANQNPPRPMKTKGQAIKGARSSANAQPQFGPTSHK